MFAHLHVHSAYSFGDGASGVEAFAEEAARRQIPALALTDRNSITGAVEFAGACAGYGIQPVIGAELTVIDDDSVNSSLTLLAETPEGFANLCRLLSRAYAHGGRLTPALPIEKLAECAAGLICLSGAHSGRVPSELRAHRYDEARDYAKRLKDWFGADRLFLELVCDGMPQSRRVAAELVELAESLRVGVVATNDCRYARKRDAFTHLLLRSVATGTTVDQPHPGKPLNAEHYVKPAAQMRQLFDWCPQTLDATLRIAERCANAMPAPIDRTPGYPLPAGYASAGEYLRAMTYKGAEHRHGCVSDSLRARLDEELATISAMQYENYFLVAWDIVRWCRHKDRRIRVTGRGSAADSAVAHALFLTDVDAHTLRLPFARFMALAEGINGPKVPDIDLDFPNSRRDDVFTYIEQRYGKGNVTRICTYSTYWARSAVRDCGKALGLPPELLRLLADNLHHFLRAGEIDAAFARPELREYQGLKEPCRMLMDACMGLEGLPRHLSVHSSGIVISRVPVERFGVVSPAASGVLPVVMWDKESAPALGIVKLDILALGIHSATMDAEVEIDRHLPAGTRFRYDRIPRNDPLTYRVLRAGDAVGAFQAESAAERAYAARLGPEHIHDLAAIIAQIRPGPIRSGVTHEYIALRNGWKRARCVPKELEEALGPTFGLVIYQEQVISVIAWCFGSSDAEADRFRKSLARHDKLGTMDRAKAEFVARTLAAHPGTEPETAEQLFERDVASWFAYGFTHGHALSFADIAEKSTYMSVHHPAAYFGAILSNQPMGYYTPMSIASEARWRGVDVQPVDINESDDGCTTPDPGAIRLGLRLVSGLRQEDVDLILAERAKRPYESLLDFAARVVIHRDRLETLILCGAFDKLHEDHRRGMLWALPQTLALARSFSAAPESSGPGQPAFGWRHTEVETPIAWEVERNTDWQDHVLTWQLTGVGPGCHPFSFLRSALAARGVAALDDVRKGHNGRHIRVAGLNIRPHRPPTRDGGLTIYTTLEDEKRHLQCACRHTSAAALETCTAALISAPALIAEGQLHRNGVSWCLNIERVQPLNMTELAMQSAELDRAERERYAELERVELESAEERRVEADPLTMAQWHMGYNVPTRLKAGVW